MAAAAVDDVAGGSECPQLYTLDFTFEPSRDGDYFAPCFPHSVRDNVQHLSSLQVTPRFSLNVFYFCHSPASSPNLQAKEHVQMSSLCLSPCLIPCDLVTITGVLLPAPPCGRPSPPADSSPVDAKTFAVITARVHPGEPSASWMMRYSVFCAARAAQLDPAHRTCLVDACNAFVTSGLIDFLVGSSTTARDLRRKYNFPCPVVSICCLCNVKCQVCVQTRAHAEP